MQHDTGTRRTGRVVFVGAGPGHPDLLTVRASAWLRRADVVVHDALVPREVLATIHASAELIPVPRPDAAGVDSGEAAGKLLAHLAASGRMVVRLKGGDPSVFARLAEELQPLRDAGIPFEIVPGVTAALAAAAAAGIPLTSRTAASSATLITGHEAGEKQAGIDFSALAGVSGTLAIYMGVEQADKWSQALIEAGKPGTTPVTIVSRCSWPDQEIAHTSLERCAADFERHRWRAPAVAIVGEVAQPPADRPAADLSLEGRRVLVPRPAGQGEDIATLIADRGGCCIHVPAIRIEPPASWDAVDDAIRRADTFDWIVFSSVNGVRSFLGRLQALGRDGRALGTARLAAVGPTTSRELAAAGYACDLVPDAFRAEGLVTAFSTAAPGGRFLLLRADRGRDVLRRELEAAGHHVTDAVAYRSTPIDTLDAATRAMLDGCRIDWVIATSPAVAEACIALFGDRMPRWRIASISPLTSAALERLGCPPTVEAGVATAEGLVEAITAWEIAHASQSPHREHSPLQARS